MALTHRGSPPIAFGKTPLLLLLPRLPLQIAEKCRVRLATYSALCSLLSALSLSLSVSAHRLVCGATATLRGEKNNTANCRTKPDAIYDL
jgi:hypothetical protein